VASAGWAEKLNYYTKMRKLEKRESHVAVLLKIFLLSGTEKLLLLKRAQYYLCLLLPYLFHGLYSTILSPAEAGLRGECEAIGCSAQLATMRLRSSRAISLQKKKREEKGRLPALEKLCASEEMKILWVERRPHRRR